MAVAAAAVAAATAYNTNRNFNVSTKIYGLIQNYEWKNWPTKGNQYGPIEV